MHGEVDQPCRSKISKYRRICEEALAPVIAPQLSCAGFLLVYECLGIICPFLDVIVDLNLSVLNPLLGYIVGIYTVGIIYGCGDVVAGLLQSVCRCVEGIPILHSCLNVSRIIGSENFLGNCTIIDQSCRASLPGSTAKVAVCISNNVLGVLILLGKICICNAKIRKLHGYVYICIGILECVVSLDQENIRLVIC